MLVLFGRVVFQHGKIAEFFSIILYFHKLYVDVSDNYSPQKMSSTPDYVLYIRQLQTQHHRSLHLAIMALYNKHYGTRQTATN